MFFVAFIQTNVFVVRFQLRHEARRRLTFLEKSATLCSSCNSSNDDDDDIDGNDCSRNKHLEHGDSLKVEHEASAEVQLSLSS